MQCINAASPAADSIRCKLRTHIYWTRYFDTFEKFKLVGYHVVVVMEDRWTLDTPLLSLLQCHIVLRKLGILTRTTYLIIMFVLVLRIGPRKTQHFDVKQMLIF